MSAQPIDHDDATDRLEAYEKNNVMSAADCVLACTMQDDAGELRDEAISAGIVADSFRDPRHQRIWKSIVRLKEKGAPPDVIMIARDLTDRREILEIGGPVTIGRLEGMDVSRVPFRHWLGIVLADAAKVKAQMLAQRALDCATQRDFAGVADAAQGLLVTACITKGGQP